MKNSLVYLGKKLIRLALLLFLISTITFLLISLAPINSVKGLVGDIRYGAMSQSQIEEIKEYWGFNTPYLVRYLNWWKALLRGDLGTSFVYRMPVTKVIHLGLKNSMPVLFLSWVLSSVIGYSLGVVSGVHRNRWQDRLIKTYSLIVTSTPTYWVGILILIVFAIKLNWFPIGFTQDIDSSGDFSLLEFIHHGSLPLLTLTLVSMGGVILHTREKVIDVYNSNYILFAKARGEKGYNLFRLHGFKNTIKPALTLQFSKVGEIIGGSILVEQVFSYQGLGYTTIRAALGGDLPLLMGITFVTGVMVFFGRWIGEVLILLMSPERRLRR